VNAVNLPAVALVPARGGSKGIPRKNLALVRGRSLLDYAIGAARDSGVVGRVVVSSDDPEILAAGERLGAVALKRPAEISGDTASSDSVIAHFIESAGAALDPAQPLVLLQPTSPLRTGAHIAEAVRIWRSGDASAVVSVFEPEHHPAKAFRLDERGELRGLFGDDSPFTPRQALPRAWQPNGAIYVFSAAKFLRDGRIPRQGLAPLVMSEAESLDIDRAADLARAERHLEGN
jgi:CMP-N,N'-diacetyllegionaminic acid synthase